VEWVQRCVTSGAIDPASISTFGPGFESGRPERGGTVLLLRNTGRFSRGRRECRLLRDARLGVYDLDDGLPWDDARLPGLADWRKRPWPRSLVAHRAAQQADRVIAGNEILANWAEGQCGDVRLIPTCVEPTDYARRWEWHVDEAPTIGWIGSPATTHYLLDLAEPLRQVHRATGARLETVGADDRVISQLEIPVQSLRWQADIAGSQIRRWDVGIMPLRDGVYERAKCGYKLLQYAAAGVPAVGSPIGVNSTMLAAMDGLAPESDAEWEAALREILTESVDRRARRAVSGFELADAYSYSRWESEWIAAVGWAEA
jgi:hypothetical protein